MRLLSYFNFRTREGRLHIHGALAFLAFVPGGIAIMLWPHSVFLVLVISWITWWGTHLAGMAAETKVEKENESS